MLPNGYKFIICLNIFDFFIAEATHSQFYQSSHSERIWLLQSEGEVHFDQ